MTVDSPKRSSNWLAVQAKPSLLLTAVGVGRVLVTSLKGKPKIVSYPWGFCDLSEGTPFNARTWLGFGEVCGIVVEDWWMRRGQSLNGDFNE